MECTTIRALGDRGRRAFRRRVRTGGVASSAQGYTLVELMFCVALTLILGGIAVPPLLAEVDEVRAAGAVRHVATTLQRARMEAIVRAADVGWRFSAGAEGYSYTAYIDGNGNGIRTEDISLGLDQPIGPVDRVSSRFQGVEFATSPALPAIDPGGAPPGTDPIKLGASNILTFTPLGSSSSGSLYLRGRRGEQYAIRIFGETGRVRVVKFDAATGRWRPA